MPGRKTNKTNRETEKKVELTAAIKKNMNVEKWHEYDSATKQHTYKAIVSPVPPYSTKTLTKNDQLLLAVDKIAYPEVKSAFEPRREDPFDVTLPVDFISIFSLNDGDKNALKIMLAAFPHFQNDTYLVSVEEGLDRHKMSVKMTSAHKDNLSFTFSLLDTENIPELLRVPAISSRFSILRNNDGLPYTPDVTWEYDISIHSSGIELPDDATLKVLYQVFQSTLRATLSFFKIIPSKLAMDKS